MPARRFKLIFLPEGTAKKHELNISRKHIIIFLGVAVLAFFVFSGGAAYVLNSWFNAKKIAALTFKNSKLEKQVKATREKLEALSTGIMRLAQSNGELRAYAHLPLLDIDLLKVGIGGALPAPISDSTGAEDLLVKIGLMERQIGLQENSLTEVRSQLDAQADLLNSIPSIRPLGGGAYSSGYGRRRDPFTGRLEPHYGVDFNGPTGLPVYAAADGVVIHAEREPAYGNAIVIDHGHGYKTLYAHLSRIGVQRGERVERGETIGALGNTGRSTGPHLHYEVIYQNRNLDPLDFMFDGYQFADLP
ncbi:MAG TPA: M23 family metallopeptidase [bacterium]|jgi:murein DD-endopeptidase MepM/ murein hydrolase activator NlpD